MTNFRNYDFENTLNRLEQAIVLTQLKALQTKKSMCLQPQGAWHQGYVLAECETGQVLQTFPRVPGHLSYNRKHLAIAATGQTAANGTFNYHLSTKCAQLTLNRLAHVQRTYEQTTPCRFDSD